MIDEVFGQMTVYGNSTITHSELGRVMTRAVAPWIGTSLRVDTRLPTWGKVGAIRFATLEGLTKNGMILAVLSRGGVRWHIFVSWVDLWTGHAIIVEGAVAASIQHGLEPFRRDHETDHSETVGCTRYIL